MNYLNIKPIKFMYNSSFCFNTEKTDKMHIQGIDYLTMLEFISAVVNALQLKYFLNLDIVENLR